MLVYDEEAYVETNVPYLSADLYQNFRSFDE